MSGTFLRRRDRTARPPRVEHYSSAVNNQDTVYAPCQSNDRLLLGLKGSLNEYELDLLRQRSLSARYEKANRMHPPRQ